MILPGKIPLLIYPSFWVLACIIGYFSWPTIIGILIWVLVVFVSVIFHELGHAWTARLMGQSAQIELGITGGLTIRHGPQLKKAEEFFVIFMGPFFGFFLGGLSYIGLLVFSNSPTMTYFMEAMLYANFFWNVLNLLPIHPLDGGKLMAIIFESLFGTQGVRFSYLLSSLFAIVLGVVCFAFGIVIGGALFLLFAYESFRSFQYLKRVLPENQEETLSLQKAESEWRNGHQNDAILLLESFCKSQKNREVFSQATELLATYLLQSGAFEKAYKTLLPYKENLTGEGLKLFQIASYETKEWQESIKAGEKSFLEMQDSGCAILNAFSSAQLHKAKEAVNWLQSAKILGTPDMKTVLASDDFDAIRHELVFKTFEKEFL